MNKTANVLTLIDTNDNDKIDTVYVKTIALEKVTYVSSKEIIAGNTSYKYEDNNIAKFPSMLEPIAEITQTSPTVPDSPAVRFA